jgi:fructosamine-3-kinase
MDHQGSVFLFDPTSFFTHHEFDIAMRRSPRHRLSEGNYEQEYLRIMGGKSAPGESPI